MWTDVNASHVTHIMYTVYVTVQSGVELQDALFS